MCVLISSTVASGPGDNGVIAVAVKCGVVGEIKSGLAGAFVCHQSGVVVGWCFDV